MPYFLSDQKLEIGKQVSLSGDEARHILLSRRIRVGERFNLQDPAGKRFEVELVGSKKGQLSVKVIAEASVPPEPKTAITLFQSFINEKALDFIFQKGTELGLYRIVLFNSNNTATKLSRDQFAKKKDRWNKILWESAKQCDRIRPPELEFTDDVEASFKDFDKVFFCDPAGNNLKLEIGNWKFNPNSVGIVVGPEGGFTPQEVIQFKLIPNVIPISLGPILLRAETAALSATAVIRNFLE